YPHTHSLLFFFNDPASTELYTLSLHDALPILSAQIAKLRAASPQVTFLVLTPGPGAQALKERQKIGWTDTVMVSSGPLTDEKYLDRKSTRLNSSHVSISYAVFCLKKKKK